MFHIIIALILKKTNFMKLPNSKQIGNKLCQNIDKMFYAIAIAEKSIHTKEIDKLKSLVREKWLDVDEI